MTEDFDNPALAIGELGEVLVRRIGLRTDRQCPCLKTDTNHLRIRHTVLNSLLPVALTFAGRPTPEAKGKPGRGRLIRCKRLIITT